MAGIDKIYGTQEQYDELKAWLKENEKPIMCIVGSVSDEFGCTEIIENILPSECLYPEGNIYSKEHRPISNFPHHVDRWLWENCPIDWVLKRLTEQYGVDNA
jgi:hypothetical protein